MIKKYLKNIYMKIVNVKNYGLLGLYPDLIEEKDFIHFYKFCKLYTMTSIERMYALHKAIHYIVQQNIEGDIVECGVWRGGSSMMCALTLLSAGEQHRRIFLYDTYSGMSRPSEKDVDFLGENAMQDWQKAEQGDVNTWCYASLLDVQKNMRLTGFDLEKCVFVKGKVEDTIPGTMPEQISLLRLDTDWYDSTYHDLVHLYPRLSPGGVLIVDDYGFWKGAKAAVDKYLQETGARILLNRVDFTGRIGVRT